jgi:LysW-gamma-L-lysine carboxypeptidase
VGESQGTDARKLLVELVETPSVSGEEAECAQHLVAFFERHGRESWTDEVGNVHAPGDDSVLLTSHIDTVPGEISVRIAETEAGEQALWGRGSVDATGSLAAMAVAAVRTGASFLGVVGEEVDSRGARHAVENRDTPDTLVNGEPSGWDAITLGYRGLLTGTYTTRTESTHAARPEPNAIQEAIDWYTRVKTGLQSTDDATQQSADDETGAFEEMAVTPTVIEGGRSEDGLAVEATMDVEVRIPPSEDVATARERVASTVEGGTVAFEEGIEPVMQSPRTPVARAFRVAIREQGGEPQLLSKTGTSDMNVFATQWDCPMVTYGPGDSTLDHTPNEHLVLSAYDRAVAVLTDATTQLLENT